LRRVVVSLHDVTRVGRRDLEVLRELRDSLARRHLALRITGVTEPIKARLRQAGLESFAANSTLDD
jgi:anti-anti-sigma regulatory factor